MAYDALGPAPEITGFTAGSMANTSYVFTHKLDAAGNLVWMGEDYTAQGGAQALPDRELALAYDGLNRLLSESVTSGGSTDTTAYTYDLANNRTSRTRHVGAPEESTWTYVYNYRNQLFTASVSVPEPEMYIYLYDLNGNRTSAAQVSSYTDYKLYSWDYENRLVQAVDVIAPRAWTFAYDYRVRRVQRVDGSEQTNYSFSGGVSVQEWQDAADEPELEYVRGPDLGGGVRGILYNLDSAGSARFLHYNSRGDVTRQSDAQGGVAYQAAYEAFGTRPNEIGIAQGAQRANTKDEESDLGLLNEGFRCRDLETGTFLSADPLGFVDGPNVYAYVRQNPWSRFDPLGLMTWEQFNYVYVGGVTEGLGIGISEAVTAPYRFGEHIAEQSLGAYDLARETGSGQAEALTLAVGTGLTRGTGALGVVESIQGSKNIGDSSTGISSEEFGSTGERAFHGAVSSVQLVGTAVGVTKALSPGGKSAQTTAAETEAVVGSQTPKGPVKPGQTDTYGALKAQKKTFGETEPMDMDHQPSLAAQIAAKEATLGRKLTPAERSKVKANTPAVASPRNVHQQTSETFGGRNTPARIAEDAADLNVAAARDRAIFDEAMKNRKP